MKEFKEIINEWKELLRNAPYTHTLEADKFKQGMKDAAEYFSRKEENGLFNRDELSLYGLIFAYANVHFDVVTGYLAPEEVDRIAMFGASTNAAKDLSEAIMNEECHVFNNYKMIGHSHYAGTDLCAELIYDFETGELTEYFDEVMAYRDSLYKDYEHVKKMMKLAKKDGRDL